MNFEASLRIPPDLLVKVITYAQTQSELSATRTARQLRLPLPIVIDCFTLLEQLEIISDFNGITHRKLLVRSNKQLADKLNPYKQTYHDAVFRQSGNTTGEMAGQ